MEASETCDLYEAWSWTRPRRYKSNLKTSAIKPSTEYVLLLRKIRIACGFGKHVLIITQTNVISNWTLDWGQHILPQAVGFQRVVLGSLLYPNQHLQLVRKTNYWTLLRPIKNSGEGPVLCLKTSRYFWCMLKFEIRLPEITRVCISRRYSSKSKVTLSELLYFIII